MKLDIRYIITQNIASLISFTANADMLRPSSRNFSDVFVTTTDRYQYSGKELDRMNGLDLYDFHARQYDPVLGRFTTPDPLSEKYYHLSPYAYCASNPLRYIDPTGKYFIDDTQAKNIEEQLNSRYSELKLLSQSDESKEIKGMMREIKKSMDDIAQMRNDKNKEYAYHVGEGLQNKIITTTNSKGEQLVIMQSEPELQFKIHETRHGGQIARGELIINESNYNILHEVDAYKAQFSVNGIINYLRGYQIYSNTIVEQSQITKIEEINESFIHSIYEIISNNNGVEFIKVYNF